MGLDDNRRTRLFCSMLVLGVLSICLYLLVLPGQRSEAMVKDQVPVLSLRPAENSIEVQQVFTIEVYLQNNEYEIVEFDFSLHFTPSAKVQITGMSPGTFLYSGGGQPRVWKNNIYPWGLLELNVAVGLIERGATGEGSLAIITGTAKSAGECIFQFKDASLRDRSGARHEPQFNWAKVIVVGQDGTPTPSPTRTATASPTATRTRTPTTIGTLVPRVRLPVVCKLYKPFTFRDGFESGGFGNWTASGVLGQRVVQQPYNGIGPKSGQFCALLGSPDWPCRNGVPVGQAAITQGITLPNASNLQLTLWYRLVSQDASSEGSWRDFDHFKVTVNGTEKFHWANYGAIPSCDTAPHDSGWLLCTVDLKGYRGQRIELALVNENKPDAWYNTWTYVDEVAIIGWGP